jgi:hypothetical protein
MGTSGQHERQAAPDIGALVVQGCIGHAAEVELVAQRF